MEVGVSWRLTEKEREQIKAELSRERSRTEEGLIEAVRGMVLLLADRGLVTGGERDPVLFEPVRFDLSSQNFHWRTILVTEIAQMVGCRILCRPSSKQKGLFPRFNLILVGRSINRSFLGAILTYLESSILRSAQIALRQAKKAGRGSPTFVAEYHAATAARIAQGCRNADDCALDHTGKRRAIEGQRRLWMIEIEAFLADALPEQESEVKGACTSVDLRNYHRITPSVLTVAVNNEIVKT
jgi:hypothetical protein